jgi:chromosome segregation ATPase
MIPFLAGLFPVRSAVIVAAILALLAGSYFVGRAHEANGWKLRESEHVAATQKAIALEQAKQREIETERQQIADTARKGLDDARQQIAAKDRAIASLRTDAGSLRQLLATYATGGAGKDPRAASVAGTLADLAASGADLLAEGADLLRACARDHDERAAEVTALLAALPR